MKLSFVLDKDDGIDPTSLLGDLTITAGNTSIKEPCTFIDSWLYVLIEGFFVLKEGKNASIDLVEEPDPLEFRLIDGKIKISYKQDCIILNSISEFEVELRIVIERLLGEISLIDGHLEVESIKFLKDFVDRKLNGNVEFNTFIKEL